MDGATTLIGCRIGSFQKNQDYDQLQRCYQQYLLTRWRLTPGSGLRMERIDVRKRFKAML